MQALTVFSASSLPASSPTTTVQAPQSPSAQPSFVPVQRKSSRRKLSTDFVGSWRSPSAAFAPNLKLKLRESGVQTAPDPVASARRPESRDDAVACIVGIPRDRGKRSDRAAEGCLEPLSP